MLYECLLLLTLWFVAGFVVVGILPAAAHGVGRALFQAYLLVVAGFYFVWCWRRGGQTLAMKTWRIRLVGTQGQPVSLRQSWLRFSLASLGTLAMGAGFLWALLDRDGQFLHDRLAGTRLVALTPLDVPKTCHGDAAEDRQG